MNQTVSVSHLERGKTSTFTFERTDTSARAVTVVTLTGEVMSGSFPEQRSWG